jgi:V8-like Glu-specific endopeptidase
MKDEESPGAFRFVGRTLEAPSEDFLTPEARSQAVPIPDQLLPDTLGVDAASERGGHARERLGSADAVRLPTKPAEKIEHPDVPPYCAIGKLFVDYGGGLRGFGSCAVVHPLGVLTAAHVVCAVYPKSKKKRWGQSAYFCPAYANGKPNEEYGSWDLTYVAVPSRWERDTDWGSDVAFARVADRDGTEVGDLVGWLTLLTGIRHAMMWEAVGYPTEAPFDPRWPYKCFGLFKHVLEGMIAKEGDLTSGASGGPWIAEDQPGDVVLVNGVQSAVLERLPGENFSPHFNTWVDDFYREIFKGRRDT